MTEPGGDRAAPVGVLRVRPDSVQMRPRQQHMIAEFRIPRSDELTSRLEEQGVETLEYASRWGRYRIRLTAADLDLKHDLLLELVQTAHGAD